MTNPELERLLHFTPGDLQVNQTGKISDAQRSRLQRKVMLAVLGTGVLSVLFIAIGVGFFSGTLMDNPEDAGLANIFALVFWGIAAILLGFLFVSGRKTLQDRNANLEQIEGKIAVDVYSSGQVRSTATNNPRTTTFTLRIGEKTFVINRALGRYLRELEGEVSRVYYYPNSSTVASMEIEKLKTKRE